MVSWPPTLSGRASIQEDIFLPGMPMEVTIQEDLLVQDLSDITDEAFAVINGRMQS